MDASALLPFSMPADGPRWLALVLGLVTVVALPWVLAAARRRQWLHALCPAAAAALSAAYVTHYLRGGPRIIDATAYWLQARALAAGLFAFPVDAPEQSMLGRFLLRTTVDGAPAASVIFPPGYPAVLSLGFAAGAPLAVGPALAAAIVLATTALARQVGHELKLSRRQRAAMTTVAALLSVTCAALRYHTADTMSHGLAGLCFATALWAALVCGREGDARKRPYAAAILGGAGGLLFATRPATGLALLLALVAYGGCKWKAGRGRPRLKQVALAALAASPAVVLWLAHQWTATGWLGGTAQQAYYALSDGPPGCFRYGFGAGVGCLGEHGDFVRARLADGFDLWAALGTSARRLQMHLSDGLGFAPLFGLVLLAAWRHRRQPAVILLGVAALAQLLCYAPFYFDGNYPGGGGRLLADVLPIEHVLAAVGLWSLGRWSPTRAAAACLALSLLGFSIHLGAHHAQLRDREGGRPMFELEVARQAPRDALLFYDTDHGFNLALNPASPRGTARFRGDDHDWLAWDARGRPPAWRYRYSWPAEGSAGDAWLEPIHFSAERAESRSLRLEGESLWPPVEQRGGWAWPSHPGQACVSGGRALSWRPDRDDGRLVLRLPTGVSAAHSLAPVLLTHEGKTSFSLSIFDDGRRVGNWEGEAEGPARCLRLQPKHLPATAHALTLVLEAPHPIAIDMLELGEKR